MDKHTIIDVLTKRTYNQRKDIAFAYEKRAKKVRRTTAYELDQPRPRFNFAVFVSPLITVTVSKDYH